jgi:hypothetical protein
MPLSDDLTEHPSPTQVHELASQFAALLRALYSHPEYKYLEPPTALICKYDRANTPRALFWVTDFVEKTYIEWILPFLPSRATRKCKDFANCWAYADPAYEFEWTWDPEAVALKDGDGKTVDFPRLPNSRVHKLLSDLVGRQMIAKKLITENATDPRAQLMLGGEKFDFGDEIRALVGAILE